MRYNREVFWNNERPILYKKLFDRFGSYNDNPDVYLKCKVHPEMVAFTDAYALTSEATSSILDRFLDSTLCHACSPTQHLKLRFII